MISGDDDGDGIPDHLDNDDDGDGIPDEDEGYPYYSISLSFNLVFYFYLTISIFEEDGTDS